ncbi:MAG: hypothetical protein JJU18_04510 [Oceanicaulis sp.]|nr:hypothetical protein [Oceanicaulis sp.]
MIAVTVLAALIIRVLIIVQILWFLFDYFNAIAEAAGGDMGGITTFFPAPALLALPVLIWIALLIWAHPLCRAFAGRHRDAQIDLGLRGADLYRLAALGGAIAILIPAASQLTFIFNAPYTFDWYIGTLLAAGIGLILLALSLVPGPAYKAALAGLRGAARSGREPS